MENHEKEMKILSLRIRNMELEHELLDWRIKQYKEWRKLQGLNTLSTERSKPK